MHFATHNTSSNTSTKSQRFALLVTHLTSTCHKVLILACSYLIFTSPWVFMARKLMPKTTWWNTAHVYLGLFTALLSLFFIISNLSHGKWKLFFPWLCADIKPLLTDIFNIFKGRMPMSGGCGLFSCIEGLGLIALFGTGLTGTFWFFTQGTADALFWRGIHINFAMGFIVYFIIHIICALSHLIEFLKN